MLPNASRATISQAPFTIDKPRHPVPLAEALVSSGLRPRSGDQIVKRALGELMREADVFDWAPYTHSYQLLALEHHTELLDVHMAPLSGGILADPLELLAVALYAPEQLGRSPVMTTRRVFILELELWALSPMRLHQKRGFVLAAQRTQGSSIELFMLELGVVGHLSADSSVMARLG